MGGSISAPADDDSEPFPTGEITADLLVLQRIIAGPEILYCSAQRRTEPAANGEREGQPSQRPSQSGGAVRGRCRLVDQSPGPRRTIAQACSSLKRV